ncbi:MAG: ABC transporter permease [Chloroflexi bacterium]|nr:ABC transporter permease [Chloroflexota bacterium]
MTSLRPGQPVFDRLEVTSRSTAVVTDGASGARGGPRARVLGGRRQPGFWRMRGEISPRLNVVLVAISLAAPLVAWVLLRASGLVNPIFLPSVNEVVHSAKDMVTSGQLAGDTWASSRRVFIGFGLAILIAVPLGLAMGSFRSINALFEPVIGFVRYMPATAFLPLLLIWLGLGEGPKVALIVIGTVFFNTLMIANAVWQVPSELIRVAFTLGGGNVSVFRKVIFPYALPGIIDAARVNLAAAWNLIVVAELVAADNGLGVRIFRAQRFLRTEEIFALLLVIGVLGVTSDVALRLVRNRLSPWSQE